MRTSDDPGAKTAAKRSVLRTVLGVLIALAAVIAIDVAATLVFEPYGNYAEPVWYEYAQGTDAGERYDTIVIGSSVAQDGICPGPIDDVLNTNSFCLAAPGESPWASLRALRTALEDHPVKRVILGTSYTALAEAAWPESDIAFVQAHAQASSQTPPKVLREFVELALDPEYRGHFKSLAFFVPFTLNHCSYTPSAVLANVRSRLECADPMEGHGRISGTVHHLGKGYANYATHITLDSFPEFNLAINSLPSFELDHGKWKPVQQIVDLCEERGIELYVVAMPHPVFETILLSDVYADKMSTVRDYAQAHGATFLDFSLAKEWPYDPTDDFLDGTHLSMAGSEKFTPILAQTIARIERGEDVSGDFFGYDEWDAYLASIDDITFTYFDQIPAEGGFLLHGVACCGTNVEVEYQYEVADGDDWVVLRPWSADPDYLLELEGYGVLKMRILARRVGAPEAERMHYQDVTYKELP